MATPSLLHPSVQILRRAIQRTRTRATRKLQKLAAEDDACAAAEECRQCGELIKAHLAEIRRGMKSVTLPDPSAPGGARTLELDPALGPMDNARRCFKAYRKRIRGATHVRDQQARCTEEIRALEELGRALDAWTASAAPEDLPPEALLQEATRLRVALPAEGRPAPRSDTAESQRRIRSFSSHDGMPILVGKTAADNDYLSLRLAHGNDRWFHAAHCSGSHVLVRGTRISGLAARTQGKGRRECQFLPQETLLDAATLAVHFSKARRAARAEVHYTQAKHVRKCRGAPPGQVTLAHHQTLVLRMEAGRLARLLAPDTPTD